MYQQTKQKRETVRYILLILSILALQLLKPMTVYAEEFTQEENEELKTYITNASNSLSEVFEENYKECEEEIKQSILQNGYDYELTMESFYENGNPFADADYVSYIAGYIAVREKNKNNTLLLSDVNFLQCTLSENSIMEYEPVKLDQYTEDEDGFYEKHGSYYLYEPMEVAVYEETENGKYKKAGMQKIDLQQVKQFHGEIVLETIDLYQLYEQFGCTYEEEDKKRVEEITNLLKNALEDTDISQSMMLSISQELNLSDEIQTMLMNLKLDSNSYNIIQNAISLIGQVPYEWGGKAKNGEIDPTWWSIGKNGKQKGLDCSGFVQWCYMAAGYTKEQVASFQSTSEMLKSDILVPCTYEELKPGDLGLLNHGERVNHVGIYLGDGYFIHCSSSHKTVCISKCEFKIYRKVTITPKTIDDINDFGVLSIKNKEVECTYSDNDIELLAKTICAEAGGEGMNGWIAVAEVIRNRLNSTLYPNTMSEVVLNKKQFSSADKIPGMQPTEEMRWVAREVLSNRLSLVGEEALYFRNCHYLGVDPASNWGKHPYVTQVGNHSFYKQ